MHGVTEFLSHSILTPLLDYGNAVYRKHMFVSFDTPAVGRRCDGYGIVFVPFKGYMDETVVRGWRVDYPWDEI
jgi:hypothetical protein